MKIVKYSSLRLMHGLLILLSAALIVSCSSKSPLSGHIPKDASVVVTVDVKSMALKSISFKDIFNLNNLKKFAGGGEKKDSTSIGDPGIDLTGKVYVFGKTSDSTKYGAVAASLSDAAKFEEFLKKSDQSLTVTEEGSLKLATFSGGLGIIGWNKNEVLAVFGSDKPKETLLSLVSLKPEESLSTTDESFKQSQKEGADISLWMSFEQLSKLAPQYGAPLGNMNFKETYLVAAINFEDGQVVINSKYTLNPETAEKYNFIKANVSSDVVNSLPGKSLIGMLGFALDMEKIYTQLEKENLISAYGQTANQMTGMSPKDLLTMLSGDIAVTVNGIEMKEVTAMDYATGQPVTRKDPQPDYVAVFGVASKEKLDKLFDQLTKAGLLTKAGDYYTFQNKVFVLEKGATLVITGSEARVKSIGGSDKLDAELVTMLNSNATSLYFNLANVPDAVFGENAEKVKRTELEAIEITGTALKDNMSTAKIIIKFKPKNENSLVTIGRVSKSFADEFKQPALPAPIQLDTTAVVN